MTTIVYRDGVMAADSRVTITTEAGGARVGRCEKLYRVKGCIIGTAGESAPGLVFIDWYKAGRKNDKVPEALILGSADFTALVLTPHGLFEYDRWCRGEKILNKFYAIGSGAKAALGAMHMGANAIRAVRIACEIDPYSSPPIVSMVLKGRNGK